MAKSHEDGLRDLAELEAKSEANEKSVFEKNEAGDSLCPKHNEVLTEITVEGSQTFYACDHGETYNEDGNIRPKE
jgi:hypothetical protein